MKLSSCAISNYPKTFCSIWLFYPYFYISWYTVYRYDLEIAIEDLIHIAHSYAAAYAVAWRLHCFIQYQRQQRKQIKQKKCFYRQQSHGVSHDWKTHQLLFIVYQCTVDTEVYVLQTNPSGYVSYGIDLSMSHFQLRYNSPQNHLTVKWSGFKKISLLDD